jgi:CBS domain containing-hemolysin-like protein
VPDVGEVIELNGYRIEIVAVDETRITTVAVAPNPARQRTQPGEPLTTG